MSMRRWKWWGPGLMLLGYLAAVYWVFTHSTPVFTDRPVTIRLAHWQVEAGPREGFAAVIRRYEQIKPRVKVEQLAIPEGTYKQWVRSNLAGGTGVDLIEFGFWMPGMTDVPPRYFEPITNMMVLPNPYNQRTPLEKVPWVNTFTDGLLDQRVNAPDPGQFYAVTITEVSLRLFCNRELLHTITGADRAPKTMVELRTLIQQVAAYAQRTGRPVHTLAGARSNTIWLMSFLMQGAMMERSVQDDRNGNLALFNRDALEDYLDGRWNFHSPEALAGFKLLREVFAGMKPGFLQATRDSAVQEFVRGDAVFIFAGTWDGTSLRTLAAFPVEVLRFPPVTADDPLMGPYFYGRTADGGGATTAEIFLNKQSPHRAEAIDFMRFMTSIEGSQLFTDHSGWLPATRDVRVPADIAAYQVVRDGYSLGATYTGLGAATTEAVYRNLYRLTGPEGGAQQLADALDAAMPAAVREDLQKEASTLLITIQPQDMRIMADDALSRRAPQDPNPRIRRERLESAQTQSESLVLQINRELARAVAAK